MSIEETYKGMWSSDPSLLKSLLDAGETILFLSAGDANPLQCKRYVEGDYMFGGYDLKEGGLSEKFISKWGIRFLIPPRPLVLEPKPLEWEEYGIGEKAIDGDFSFYAYHDGDWGISSYGQSLTGCDAIMPDWTIDTAKAAIHEWRVNHLKSMLP